MVNKLMYPFYTEFEDEVIHTHYTEKGAGYCHNLIPRRTIEAIKRRAHQLKIPLPVVVVNISDRTIIQRWRRGMSFGDMASTLGVSVDRVTRVMMEYRKGTAVESGALELPPKGWEADSNE